MPEENMQSEENFVKKKVGRTVKKRIVKSDIAEEVKEKPIKKPARIVAKPRVASKTSAKDRELNERLSSIYRDTDGKIPNMREIKVKKGHPVIRGFFTLLIVAGLMALTAWAGFFYLPGNKNKADKQIDFYVEGPTRTDIGATTTYKIVFKNKESIVLKNAVISVNYPDNFVFYESSMEANNPGHTEWRVGDIAPNKSGELTITGLNYSEPEKESSWRVFINYIPENFQSEMQEISTLKTVMNRMDVDFSLTGPEKALLGDETTYSINIKFPEEFSGDTLKIIPTFPANFTLTSSSPNLQNAGYWLVSRLIEDPGKKQEITFIGRFGEAEALNDAKISIVLATPRGDKDFSIAEKSITTALAQNKYSASLAINGSITDFNSHPGETLNMTAQFKNTGEDDIKDAMMKINLDAPSLNNKSCLNWGAISDEKTGDITGTQLSENIRRGQIVWSKNQIPELEKIAPGQTVEVDLQIPVQNTTQFDMSSLKEYIITASLDVAFTEKSGQLKDAGSNKISITLNSDLTLENRSRNVTEDGATIKRITWLLNNSFHPLKNVRLTAEIFGDSTYVAPEEIPAGEITYDETTKKVTWVVAEMPLELDAAGLSFDIILGKTDPTQKAVMGKTSLSAEDTVTGQTIYLAGDEIGI